MGLDGQHGTKTPPKCLPDEEAAAKGLDESHAKASHPVASVILPRPVDGLEAQEAGLHLKERNAFDRSGVIVMDFISFLLVL